MLSVTAVTQGTHGGVTFLANGSVTYRTPPLTGVSPTPSRR